MNKKNNLKIAISGASGCGNTTVSILLAKKLNLSCINYTFKNVAQEMKISFSEILEKAKTDFYFDKIVDSKQIEMASKGNCVLASRLAIWLLKNADFKIYLDASLETRVRRIQKREGGSTEELRIETIGRDSEDTRRYRELYNIDNTKYDFVDLVIDTEKYSPEKIVDNIIMELKRKKLI